MGGNIRVTSEIGKGSTFEFFVPLPAVKAGETAPSPNTSAADANTQQKQTVKILLVEDYEANVLVAKSFLHSFGYECDVATNGREAVDKARKGKYAVILMDVQMHELNGLEATQLIRAHEQQHGLRRIPIIGMTAHALFGDRERCISAGMDDYISKPFNGDDLKLRIERAIKNPPV
jgi:CheY-like chemotaxis protein